MADDQHDPERPARLAAMAAELAEYFGERQKVYARRAEEFGYSRDVFTLVARNLEHLPDDPLLAAPEVSLKKFRVFAEAREKAADKLSFDISSAAFAIAGTTSSTAAAIAELNLNAWIQKVTAPQPPPHWSSGRRAQYAARLEMRDPELGRLARSVWQSFYGGADNAERSSLLSMRQLYDHLFSLLAPDEKVRDTAFFSPKVGTHPDQVHRRERLHYAAATHIIDPALRGTLLSQVEHILQLYDRLNELHARRPLDRERVQELLLSMEGVLEQWVDALSA